MPMRWPRSLALGLLLLGALPALAQGRDARRGGAAPAARFRQLDRNGDGRLSADELTRPCLHEQMDADGDGGVTMDEARAFLAARARQDAEAPEPTMRTHLNVPYAKAEGARPSLLSLDVYAPKGGEEVKGRSPGSGQSQAPPTRGRWGPLCSGRRTRLIWD
ncbi:hypothetical protein ACFL09_02175 [Planctomycetota bacterium]